VNEIWHVRMRSEFVAGTLFFSLTLSTPIGRNVDLGIYREHLGDPSVLCWKRGDPSVMCWKRGNICCIDDFRG
jgi:hypothetical protein